MWMHTVKTYVYDLDFYSSFTKSCPLLVYSDPGNPHKTKLLQCKHSLRIVTYSDATVFSSVTEDFFSA